jgi:hypothetical protein
LSGVACQRLARPARRGEQLVVQGRERGAAHLPGARLRANAQDLAAAGGHGIEQRLLLRGEFVEGVERQPLRRRQVPVRDPCSERVGQARLVDPAARIAGRRVGRRPGTERAAVAVLAEGRMAEVEPPAVQQRPRLGRGGRGPGREQQHGAGLVDHPLPQRRGLGGCQQRRARTEPRLVPGAPEPTGPGEDLRRLPGEPAGREMLLGDRFAHAPGESPVRCQHRPSGVDQVY